MLVLSRKVGERIQIGDQICIVIVRINGNAVRVGIEAPADMSVLRAELQERTNQDAIVLQESSLCEESPAP